MRTILPFLVLVALVAAVPTVAEAAGGRSPARSTAVVSTGPVNINTASVEELDALPGIGPALAQRIADYRREHGPFTKVDDLLNVKGIGAKLLARIRERLTVGGPRDVAAAGTANAAAGGK
jgi:competence protein ComEA